MENLDNINSIIKILYDPSLSEILFNKLYPELGKYYYEVSLQ